MKKKQPASVVDNDFAISQESLGFDSWAGQTGLSLSPPQ